MPQFLTGPYQIKRGATSPPYRVYLTNADKSPVDLSQANYAHFVLRQRYREREITGPAVDSPMVILQVGSDPTTATNVGWAEYDWQPGDTDVPGVYDAEVALYDANDQVYARVPSNGYLEVQILGSLSPGGGGQGPSGPPDGGNGTGNGGGTGGNGGNGGNGSGTGPSGPQLHLDQIATDYFVYSYTDAPLAGLGYWVALHGGDFAGSWIIATNVEISVAYATYPGSPPSAMARTDPIGYNSDQYSEIMLDDPASLTGFLCGPTTRNDENLQQPQFYLAGIQMPSPGDTQAGLGIWLAADGMLGHQPLAPNTLADIAPGDIIRLVSEGDVHTLYQNDVKVCSVTDGTLSGGTPGMYGQGSQATVLQWTGGNAHTTGQVTGGVTGQIDAASPPSMSISDASEAVITLTGSGFLTFDYTDIQMLLMTASGVPVAVSVDTSSAPTDTELASQPFAPATTGLDSGALGTGYVVVFSESPPQSGNFIEVTNRLPFDFVA